MKGSVLSGFTFTTLLLSLGGGLICALIFMVGASATPASQALVRTPEFSVWLFVNVLLFAYYPLLLAMAWPPLKSLTTDLAERGEHVFGEIFLTLVLLTFAFSVPLLLGGYAISIEQIPLPHAQTRVILLEGIGYLLSALPVTVGVWLTQAAARAAFITGKPLSKDINLYLRYRNFLYLFLVLLGIALSLMILTTAALRAVGLESGAATLESYPTVLLLVVGVYNTLLAALVFFPAYFTLHRAGGELLEAYYPTPSLDYPDWLAQYERRQRAAEMLGLSGSHELRLLTTIAVLAPFFTSVVSIIIGE